MARIKAEAMDMWEPYFEATHRHVPGAADKIVHDRFHVMKHVGEAVDRVRKHEHRELIGREDHQFKGTKDLWLCREENLHGKHRPALETLKAANLKVAKALAMKESLNDVWKYLSTGWARRFVKRWLAWVNKSGLTPMCKDAGLIQRHLEDILTFCRHRITSGVAEGLKSKIMSIKRKACSYRNRNHCPVSS